MWFQLSLKDHMQAESFIVGKDASLESSIRTMQAKLLALGFNIEERSWLNPIEGIWSVHIRDRDCPLMFTNGKGATRLACLASALGEFFERLSCNYFWNHYYLGYGFAEGQARPFVHYPQEKWFAIDEQLPVGQWPQGILNASMLKFYNPNQSIDARSLVDFNSGDMARGICAIPYVCQRDHTTAYIPVNIIANLYVSNGMSAGNTQHEARAQALSEIFERYVKFKIISEGICLPDVPPEVIARYPSIAAGVQGLRDAGFGVLVKDASLGGAYPVMCVTLLNPKDQGCYASFGAHPRFEVALERALTELLQGRALDALDGFPEPGFDLDEIASSPNIEIHFVDSSGLISWNFLGNTPDYPWVDWNFSSTTQADYQWLIDTVHRLGFDAYIADFTHLGVYACRVIVPGMSEIYPVDELEWENNSIANPIREAILNLSDLDDDECSDLLDTLNENGTMDDRLVPALIGLAPGADPFWKDLRVGELKTLLALACGDEDGIAQGCDWVRQFGQVNEQRKQVYSCIEALTKLYNANDYLQALMHLYGEHTLASAQAHLTGEQRFFNQSSPGLGMVGCDMHTRLLQAYGKLHPTM